jgi:hypothetical protein
MEGVRTLWASGEHEATSKHIKGSAKLRPWSTSTIVADGSICPAHYNEGC